MIVDCERYEHQHGKQMSTKAIAQMLSNTLYYKRFFPYYTFNLVAGLNEKGKCWWWFLCWFHVLGEGVVYGYDAIGSYEAIEAGAQGSGQMLVQALLDNQVAFKNQKIVPAKPITMEEAVSLVKDAFTSAGERDIYTGDAVEIVTISKDGMKKEVFELKKD